MTEPAADAAIVAACRALHLPTVRAEAAALADAAAKQRLTHRAGQGSAPATDADPRPYTLAAYLTDESVRTTIGGMALR